MGLLSLYKRIIKGSQLTTAEVDNNWEKIENLFPTPASGSADIGKTLVLNSAKTGFEYASLSGSTTGFLPNGTVTITESGEFQASYKGKIVKLSGDSIQLTMPEVNPFEVGDHVGVMNATPYTVGSNPNAFNTKFEGVLTIPQYATQEGENAECVILSCQIVDGVKVLVPISTYTVSDVDIAFTGLRKLYYDTNIVFPDDKIFFNQKFITDADFDGDNNYVLTKEDFDSLLIFYVDRDVYPNFQVKVPEELVDYVFDLGVHIPKIGFTFIDSGVYQVNFQSYFTKPLSQRESNITGGAAETRYFLVFPPETEGAGVILYDVSEQSVLKITDENDVVTAYTSQYVIFTNGLQSLFNVIVVEDDDEKYMKNGINLIVSAVEGEQVTRDNVMLRFLSSQFPLGSEITVIFACTCTSIDFNGAGSFTNLPDTVERGTILTFRKYGDGGDSSNFYLVNMTTVLPKEQVVTLGVVTFEDVNAAAADSEIFINLNSIPAGFYPEKIFQKTEIFDADISNAGVQSNATGVNSNAYIDVAASTVTTVSLSDDANATQDYNDLQFRITFNTVNPQNLTTGSIIIKALIREFPN